MLVSVDSFSPISLGSRKKFNDVGEFKGSPTDKLNIFSCNNSIVMSLRESSIKWSKHGIMHEIYLDVEDKSLFYIRKIMFRFVFKSGYTWNLEISLCDTYVYKVLVDMICRGSFNVNSLHNYISYWRILFRFVVENNENLTIVKSLLLGGV